MAKVAFFSLLILIVLGCSSYSVKREELYYEFVLPPSYPLTSEYQYLHVVFDDKKITPPEPSLSFERLKLVYTQNPKRADIMVYFHFSPSYFVHREPTSVRVIEFDEKGKGKITYKLVNRGYIRTGYTVEVVDVLQDKLIFDTQGAGNFDISVAPWPTKHETQQALINEFNNFKQAARSELATTLWEGLKTNYLNDLLVGYTPETFHIVAEHRRNPNLKQAFDALSKKTKAGAKQALALYNKILKSYDNKDKASLTDEDKKVISYANEGITASAKIVNSPNPIRPQ